MVFGLKEIYLYIGFECFLSEKKYVLVYLYVVDYWDMNDLIDLTKAETIRLIIVYIHFRSL